MIELDPVRGYCTPLSAKSGEPVRLHLSATEPLVDVVIAREGASRQVVALYRGVKVEPQTDPDNVVSHGCGWPAALTFQVLADWRSGYYSVTYQHPITGAYLGEAYFVVRPSGKPGDMLLVIAANTYNAYNWYGGASLYAKVETGILYNMGTTRASFERPLPRGYARKHAFECRLVSLNPPDRSIPVVAWSLKHGYDQFSAPAGWFNWEYPLVQWLERQGWRVDIAISSDLELHPDVLDGHRLYLSCGKDEYWTWEARDTVEAFVDSGGRAAFFSGCTAFWQVRLEDEGRAMTGYKLKYAADPVLGTTQQNRLTGLWSHRLVGRSENSLTGLSFARGGYVRFGGAVPRSAGGFTVYRPRHWVFEGLDLEYGDQIGTKDVIAGYECDGCAVALKHGLPVPTGEDGAPDSLEILAMAPASLLSPETAPPALEDHETLSDLEYVADQVAGSTDPESLARFAHGYSMVAHHKRGKGEVFAAGCTDWVYGLIGCDPLIERITQNVVRRLMG
jgi:hypothetical protein